MTPLFKTQCESCHFEFSMPHLSDFSYGEFLFSDRLGAVYMLFNALDSPCWAFLQAVLVDFDEDLAKKEAGASLLQSACAHFANQMAGQPLRNGSVCPVCHSSKLKIFDAVVTGSRELPRVSFSEFMARPEPERRRLALQFYASHSPNKPFKNDARKNARAS